MASFAAHVEALLRAGRITDKASLHEAKRQAMGPSGLPALPTDRALAAALPEEARARFQEVLRTKPMRTRSGVAVVAVMSSPAACPHGKCTFCPGGPEVGAPQSYTGFEPSTMRARRHGYDPYLIVRDRLAQLAGNGHAVGKVDVVVQGGTFPARDPAYQDWFIAGIYAGLNDGPAPRTEGLPAAGADEAVAGTRPPRAPAPGAMGAAGASWDPAADTQQAWALMPAQARQARLEALQAANEAAACRCVGLTIETKPDWCHGPHLDAMLRHGATRVEVGLQTLDPDVLQATHRGHTLDDSRRALQLARDAGFKVCAHLMPGLPRRRAGTKDQSPDPEADLEDWRRLFEEPDWRPDMLKVYPTLVVQEGETALKRLWQAGLYKPLDTAAAAALVAAGKSFVPEWCRIQRIDRDIPTTHVQAGVQNSNLRQLAQLERARLGLPPCRCLRCREVGNRDVDAAGAARAGASASTPGGAASTAPGAQLVRTAYEASGGQEVFLAFEDPASDAVLAYLRLRRVARPHRPEALVAGGAAFVRELKVLGRARAVGGDDDPEAGTYQHQGLGAALLREAERVAFVEWGVARLLVIAGPGVKPYYRRHGFRDLGPYVAKDRA